MNQNIRMIATDLDGTLLNSKGEVSAATVQAVQRAVDAGIVVLPATGRQLTGIPTAVLALPGNRYAVTANGALVVDRASGRVLHEDCFPFKQALGILRLLEQYDGMPGLYIEGVGYAQEGHLEKYIQHLSSGLINYFRTSRTMVPNLQRFLESAKSDVEKLTILFMDEEVRQQALAALVARGDSTVTSSLAMNLEINTRTANKGAGLLALAKQLGIAKQQVMAIGDSSNDEAMLRAVGRAVAMGNATDDIKRLADTVTLSNDEDGVAAAINEVL